MRATDDSHRTALTTQNTARYPSRFGTLERGRRAPTKKGDGSLKKSAMVSEARASRLLALQAELDELETRDVVDGERHYRLVHFAAFLGKWDRALDHLERTTDGGFFNASYLERDPWVASLRTDPRFLEMLGSAKARHDTIESRLNTVEGTQ